MLGLSSTFFAKTRQRKCLRSYSYKTEPLPEKKILFENYLACEQAKNYQYAGTFSYLCNFIFRSEEILLVPDLYYRILYPIFSTIGLIFCQLSTKFIPSQTELDRLHHMIVFIHRDTFSGAMIHPEKYAYAQNLSSKKISFIFLIHYQTEIFHLFQFNPSR